jgi:hypothetical protein
VKKAPVLDVKSRLVVQAVPSTNIGEKFGPPPVKTPVVARLPSINALRRYFL